jgi:chemotaxis protein methyltransferase CheR
MVTELVINAIKYAFPTGKAGAQIRVTYEVNDPDWKLMVSDNGVGEIPGKNPLMPPGLGTTIVNALAKQLDARMDSDGGDSGLSVSITSHSPQPG